MTAVQAAIGDLIERRVKWAFRLLRSRRFWTTKKREKTRP
jgi:hypothetical protein